MGLSGASSANFIPYRTYCRKVGERVKKKSGTRTTQTHTSWGRLNEHSALRIPWNHTVWRWRPPTPVNYRITNTWFRFRDLKRALTDSKLPTSLRLRLFGSAVVSFLLFGCKSWKITEKASLTRQGCPLSTLYCAPDIYDGTSLGIFLEWTSDEWSDECRSHASSQHQNRFLAT